MDAASAAFPLDLTAMLTRAEIDLTLERNVLQETLHCAIAARRYCGVWSVGHMGCVVQSSAPEPLGFCQTPGRSPRVVSDLDRGEYSCAARRQKARRRADLTPASPLPLPSRMRGRFRPTAAPRVDAGDGRHRIPLTGVNVAD